MSLNNLKIGEVADRLNITVRTIRYYEEEGLIEPYRTSGGTRLYSEHDLARLKAIIHLTENGFPLEIIRVIKQTREACTTGDEGSNKVSGVIGTAIEDIENRITNLRSLKTELVATKKQVEKCVGCTNEPSSKGCPTCHINNKLDDIELLNLVWK